MMTSKSILWIIIFPLFAQAQEKNVTAGIYPWPIFKGSTTKNDNVVMLSGTANDLSFLEVSAVNLAPGKKSIIQSSDTEEHLLLVKEGVVSFILNDSTFSLGKGSVAMLMPTEKCSLQNKGTTPCQIHLMKYTSREPVDLARGKAAGGSLVIDWNNLNFRPHERGGVRPYFDRATANTKKFEMHVTTLKENFNSHDAHKHPAEEIILVLEGKVEMMIGEKSYQANAGDVLFAPTNVLHGLKNNGSGQCSYFAYQWE